MLVVAREVFEGLRRSSNASSHEEVLGLDVPVRDAARVRERERAQELRGDALPLARREPPAGARRRQPRRVAAETRLGDHPTDANRAESPGNDPPRRALVRAVQRGKARVPTGNGRQRVHLRARRRRGRARAVPHDRLRRERETGGVRRTRARGPRRTSSTVLASLASAAEANDATVLAPSAPSAPEGSEARLLRRRAILGAVPSPQRGEAHDAVRASADDVAELEVVVERPGAVRVDALEPVRRAIEVEVEPEPEPEPEPVAAQPSEAPAAAATFSF